MERNVDFVSVKSVDSSTADSEQILRWISSVLRRFFMYSCLLLVGPVRSQIAQAVALWAIQRIKRL